MPGLLVVLGRELSAVLTAAVTKLGGLGTGVFSGKKSRSSRLGLQKIIGSRTLFISRPVSSWVRWRPRMPESGFLGQGAKCIAKTVTLSSSLGGGNKGWSLPTKASYRKRPRVKFTFSKSHGVVHYLRQIPNLCSGKKKNSGEH